MTHSPTSNHAPEQAASDMALSGQERQALQAAQKGYDDSVGALPDADQPGGSQADLRAKTPPLPAGQAAPDAQRTRTSQAQNEGLLPQAGETTAPLDVPAASESPTNLDPASGPGAARKPTP